MKHLTDIEFIDYCLKFETDPKIVRLAKIMDNMPGIILDELEHAGMDPENCTFENTYSPGQYITHLENEIEYLNRELSDTQEKLAERETLSVIDLISELRDSIYTEKARASLAVKYQHEAEKREEEMKKKLDMWAILNR